MSKGPLRSPAIGLAARLRALAAGVLLGLAAALAESAAANSFWPRIPLPENAHAFDIASEPIVANGIPMQIRGFLSEEPPTHLAEWFRQTLGKLVENRIGDTQVLGQARGEFYVTVQLEPTTGGTRGVVAVSHLKGAYESKNNNQALVEHWLARLPAGSRLVSHVASEDVGKVSTYLVFVNGLDEDLNLARVREALCDEGFELERDVGAEAMTTGTGGASQGASSRAGVTSYYRGRGKEAMTVVYPDVGGRTVVVMNIITALEHYK